MAIFNQDTQIWMYASYFNKIDEYLAKAETLINRWSTMEFNSKQYMKDEQGYIKQFFKNEGEFHIAAILLFDNLLPSPARQAFSCSTILAREELRSNYICKSLMMSSPKKGRKKSNNIVYRNNEVTQLLSIGYKLQKVYEIVANNFNVAPVTVRRDYERSKKI